MFDRDNNSLLVNLNVLDTPPYSIRNNSSPREQVVSTLMEKVNSGKVKITLGGVTITPKIRMPPNNTCHSSSHPHPTATTSMTVTPSATCVKAEESKGVSTGAAAGLSIGVFVVGIFVGAVSAILITWMMRRGKTGSYSNLQ